MMRKIISIALLNFKQATRERLFLGAVFFFMLYLAFCLLLGVLSVGMSEKVIREAGLAGIELTAGLLMIFSFISSAYREKETRMIEVYLSSFPRPAYVLGRVLGYFLISFSYLAFCGAAYALVLVLFKAYSPVCLIALFPVLLKLTIVISAASLFSSLYASSAVALLMTLFFCLAAESAQAALQIVSLPGYTWERTAATAVYFFLPNLDKFDMKSLAAYAVMPGPAYFLWILAYTFVYSLVLWLINIRIFQSKEH